MAQLRARDSPCVSTRTTPTSCRSAGRCTTDSGSGCRSKYLHLGTQRERQLTSLIKHFKPPTCSPGGSQQWRLARRNALCLRVHAASTSTVQTTENHSVKLREERKKILSAFSYEGEVSMGQLIVRALQDHDVSAASVLLRRAFPENFTFTNIQQYFTEMLRAPPDGVLLIARLIPHDKSLLGDGKGTRLVGTVALSFNRASRDHFRSLQPPDNAIYLANMAVDARFRRVGIAKAMLACCEQLAGTIGIQEIYLHANLDDDPAIKLYNSIGYSEIERDSPVVHFMRTRPRMLMRRAFCLDRQK